MVARKTTINTEDRRRTGADALFQAWRVLLARLGSRIANSVRTCALLLSSQAVGQGLSSTHATVSAVCAIAGGIVFAGLVGWSHDDALAAVATSLVGAMWVAARLVVMRVVARGNGDDLSSTTIAWAAGALFFVVAITPLVRIFTWVAGAVLSYRTLRAADILPGDARPIVAWGYGIEAAGLFVVWLLGALAIFAYL